jgi:hypothetical protein
MTDQHDRRSYDAGLARLEQKIDDMSVMIKDRETACQSAIHLRLNAQEGDIRTLKKFMYALETPVRAIGWSIVLIVGAILTIISTHGGEKLWEKLFK